MLVTLDGLVIEVKAVAFANALFPMLVTLVPTITDLIADRFILLGTVRVPNILILVVFPSVRVNVVPPIGYSTNIVTYAPKNDCCLLGTAVYPS